MSTWLLFINRVNETESYFLFRHACRPQNNPIMITAMITVLMALMPVVLPGSRTGVGEGRLRLGEGSSPWASEREGRDEMKRSASTKPIINKATDV